MKSLNKQLINSIVAIFFTINASMTLANNTQLSSTNITITNLNKSNLIKAEAAYRNDNLNELNNLVKNNPKEPTISYLLAKAMLSHNKIDLAQKYINLQPNGYMKNDLIHQALIFYYNKNDYANYKNTFLKLHNSQISQNETCGFELASLKLDQNAERVLNRENLINNSIPIWCTDLVALEFKYHNINKNELYLMLYNLIATNKIDFFNQIAAELKTIPTISLNKFETTAAPELIHNNFLVVGRITQIARKDPQLAVEELKQALDTHDNKINSTLKTFLANYIALQFTLRQDFNNAASLFDSNYSNSLSNDEFEWRVRCYLALNKWDKVIKSIEDMPDTLKNKNVWLYWLAKAYTNTKQPNLATNTLKQIPNDYSYYSLLGSAELNRQFKLLKTPPLSSSIANTQLATNVDYAISLYRIAKINHCRGLATIATYQWYYLARIANPEEQIAMSNQARKLEFYDLSIYAANQLNNRYFELSFPLPFIKHYNKYSQNGEIESSYPLAISRQESRFNYNVIAFDGGMGLMQLMPQTAIYILHKAGYNNCSEIIPDCNIKLGTWYLSNLYKKFGNIIYATAAYNAGPNRSQRWYNNLNHLDNRIQIELIPIAITRDYVQKVITNKAIYDSRLKGQAQINLLNYIRDINKNGVHSDLNILSDDQTDANKMK